jgi:hypothetical protein
MAWVEWEVDRRAAAEGEAVCRVGEGAAAFPVGRQHWSDHLPEAHGQDRRYRVWARMAQLHPQLEAAVTPLAALG